MVGKLVLSYVLNLIDAFIMLCFFHNDKYMNLYHLPRAWMNDDLGFIVAKVFLVAMLLLYMYDALMFGRRTLTQFKIESWILILIYALLIIYDVVVLIMGGTL